MNFYVELKKEHTIISICLWIKSKKKKKWTERNTVYIGTVQYWSLRVGD